MTDSLGDALPKELARVREVLAVYKSLGPAGTYGAIMIERDLQAADQAMISGDVVAMLRCYESLKGIE